MSSQPAGTPIQTRRPFNAINSEVQQALREGRSPATVPLYESSLLETLDGMPFSEYAQIFRGRIKDASDGYRFDTLRVAGGTTPAKGVRNLFEKPFGRDDAKTADGATTYTKDEADTNMKLANMMEYGNILIVESLQVGVRATTRAYNADTAGRPTDLTPGAAGTNAASNTVAGLCENVWLTLKVGEKTRAEGTLDDFPPQGGLSGAFGADADEGFAQNGWGTPRFLREIIILKPGQLFTVSLNFLAAMVMTQDVNIKVKLAGVILRPV